MGKTRKKENDEFNRKLLQWATRVLPAFLAILVIYMISTISWSYVRNIQEYQLDENSLQLVSVPDWVPEDAIDSIKNFTSGSKKRSIFEDNLLTDLEKHLKDNTWVKEVNLIERRYPNTIIIDISFRKGVALVKYDGEYYTIDDKCTVLDEPAYNEQNYLSSGLPVILGISNGMPKYYGQRINNGKLISSINLLLEIQESNKQWTAELAGLKASGSESNPDFIVYLNGYPPIKWGKNMPVANYNEIDNWQKIEKLDNNLSDKGFFEPGECIDIRFGGSFSRYFDQALINPLASSNQ